MRIEDFLTKHIEGYLFCDLENMSRIVLPPWEEYGAAGYPMITSILAGMELLGGILSLDPFSDKDRSKQGETHFNNYWDNYFTKVCLKYDKNNLGLLFRNLLRHGLAHTFLAKPGVLVTKGSSGTHLQYDTRNNILSIDVVIFYKDFKKSYFNLVRPIIYKQEYKGLTIKDNMESRLNEMVKVYSADSNNYFKKIPPQTNTSTTSFSANASTSVQNITASETVPFINSGTRLEP